MGKVIDMTKKKPKVWLSQSGEFLLVTVSFAQTHYGQVANQFFIASTKAMKRAGFECLGNL